MGVGGVTPCWLFPKNGFTSPPCDSELLLEPLLLVLDPWLPRPVCWSAPLAVLVLPLYVMAAA